MTSQGRNRRPSSARPKQIEILLENPANAGASVGRDADGRAIFCDGGLPGETVLMEITTQQKRFARGRVLEVLDASAGRQEPACRTHHAGCGGCDMAHASPAAQLSIKAQVVKDSLIRIGRLDPEIVQSAWMAPIEAAHAPVIPARYRTTVRTGIVHGRVGYRKRSSHSVVAANECLVVHELLENLFQQSQFPNSAGPEVVLRVSNATGERIAIVDGSPDGVVVPDGVSVVTKRELEDGREISMTEVAAGREWKVSAGSFFQAGPEVASALVSAVRIAAGDVGGAAIVDAYSGIGLFAGTVGTGADSVIALEQSGSSAHDARHNLAGMNATIVETAVEDWDASPADIVIADPSRAGLGVVAVDALVASDASRFVLVACDTGSLGRDVGLLVERGYMVDSIQIIDAFHDTSHVETVIGLAK